MLEFCVECGFITTAQHILVQNWKLLISVSFH